jgi:hypothetical protein
MKHKEMVMTALGLIELNQEIVRELLDYFPETGELIWRERGRKWFTSDGAWKKWNTRRAGTLGFASINDGYKRGTIFGKQYYAHRIIWLYMTGDWPDPEVDHDNQDRLDNRWENLSENDRFYGDHNRSLRRDNTSGYSGVRKHRAGWQMRYYDHEGGFRGRTFPTEQQAIAARKAIELEFGYNKNHGAQKDAKKEPAPWARSDGLVEILNYW